MRWGILCEYEVVFKIGDNSIGPKIDCCYTCNYPPALSNISPFVLSTSSMQLLAAVHNCSFAFFTTQLIIIRICFSSKKYPTRKLRRAIY